MKFANHTAQDERGPEDQCGSGERRFHVMVDEFQGKLLWRFVAYWLIYQFALWNFMFCWQLLSEGKGNPVEQFHRFFNEHYPMVLCFAIFVPFFAWDAVKFSHCVLGPLSRIRQTIRAISAGETIREVKQRNGDHLTELVDDLNVLLEALEERGVVVIDRSFDMIEGRKPAKPEVRSEEGFEGRPQGGSLTSNTV